MMPVHFCPSDKAAVLIAWGRRKHQNHQGECHTEVSNISNINIDTVKFFFFFLSVTLSSRAQLMIRPKKNLLLRKLKGRNARKGKSNIMIITVP